MKNALEQTKGIYEAIMSELERFYLLWRYQHRIPPVTMVLKRSFDFLGAVSILLLASPILILLAVLIKLDDPKGPIFYSQTRVGQWGRPFKMFKFRSMRTDAEANGPVWCAQKDDPRMTRMGGFLRHSHLDELPQLWNVIRGDMSIVGPRPERPHFVSELNRSIPQYSHRLLVRPGITGLAQVYYRYDASVDDVKRKLRFDLLYVKRIAVGLDVQIMFWTLSTILFNRLLPFLKESRG